jgi:hypothetical protein
MNTRTQQTLEAMATFLVVAFVSLFGWVTVAPYFMVIPLESQQLIVQQITTIQNIMLAVVSFFFGQSSGNLKKDATISDLAKNVPAVAPPQVGVTMGTGETATINTQTSTEVTTHEGQEAPPKS